MFPSVQELAGVSLMGPKRWVEIVSIPTRTLPSRKLLEVVKLGWEMVKLALEVVAWFPIPFSVFLAAS